jgi:hypothetical protein
MAKSVKRIVDTEFWNDDLVMDHFTPEDKYFMLYLLTNPHTRQSGIYKILKRNMAFETGYSKETVDYLIMRFQDNYGLIEYSHKTQEVAILNYLKYSIVKGGKPVNDCIRKDLATIKDRALISKVNKHLLPFFEQTEKVSLLQIKDILNENDKENDNDNERIVDESWNYDDIITLWNGLEFKQVKKLTDKRKKQIKARIKEYGYDDFVATLNKMKDIQFFKDNIKSNWFDIDWVMNPNNFIKVFEGKYEGVYINGYTKETTSKHEPDWLEDVMKEL